MGEDSVTLVADSRKYEFSKKKLSKCSTYFNAMFNGEFIEKNKPIIKLEGISATALEYIWNYVTLGKVCRFSKETPVEKILDLLQAAAMLQLTEVQELCSRTLFNILDVSNAIPILEIASRLDSSQLIHKATAIALWNFDDVTKLDAFFQLSAEQVKGYVSDKALHSWTGEWGVWEAINRWLNSSEENEGVDSRSVHLPKLIQCLHLNSLSLSDLRCIALYESVKSCPVVSKAIGKIIKNRISESLTKETDMSEEKQEASDETDVFIAEWQKTEPRRLPYVPAVVGNICVDVDMVMPCILKFSEAEGKFIPVVRLNTLEYSLCEMVGFKVIANGSKLFLLGGMIMRRQNAWNHTVWMYDQILKSWTALSNLLKPSRHLSACFVENDLYVIGGFGRHRVVQDSVSKLNVNDRTWTTCAPLPRPVYSVPCCVFRNHIYVIESVIYQYIPSRDVWITLDFSPNAKVFANAMANEDFIYLSESYTRNIYKFDPNASSIRLELLGTFKHECVQACLIDDHIYSLSQADFGEEIYCEKLNIFTGKSSVLWEGKTDDNITRLDPQNRHGCFPLLQY